MIKARDDNDVKLLPCPFCGGYALTIVERVKGHAYVRIECSSCLVGSPSVEFQPHELFKARREAVSFWNTRAGSPALRALDP